MGAVYLAEDKRTSERVAVKVVLGSATRDEASLQRLLRESRAAASIVHPAVARTLWVDVSADGLVYLVQELVDGVGLDQVLGLQRSFSSGEIARVGAVLAAGLAEAHAAGVVHRDLKPSNVMVTAAAPGLKLLDFGIARMAVDPEEPEITRAGRFLGTPDYMAPEQLASSDRIEPSLDVYAFGRVLYRALAGRLPDKGSHPIERAFVDAAPVTDFAPSVSPELSAIVMACLGRDPAARPAAREAMEALAALADRAATPSLPELAARWVASVRARSPEAESASVTLEEGRNEPTWSGEGASV
jgi:serine/threonine-protein kinase